MALYRYLLVLEDGSATDPAIPCNGPLRLGSPLEVWALVSAQARETVELCATRAEAEADLERLLADDEELAGLLSVERVELTTVDSLN